MRQRLTERAIDTRTEPQRDRRAFRLPMTEPPTRMQATDYPFGITVRPWSSANGKVRIEAKPLWSNSDDSSGEDRGTSWRRGIVYACESTIVMVAVRLGVDSVMIPNVSR
jgi:hypothetical protein